MFCYSRQLLGNNREMVKSEIIYNLMCKRMDKISRDEWDFIKLFFNLISSASLRVAIRSVTWIDTPGLSVHR